MPGFFDLFFKQPEPEPKPPKPKKVRKAKKVKKENNSLENELAAVRDELRELKDSIFAQPEPEPEPEPEVEDEPDVDA